MKHLIPVPGGTLAAESVGEGSPVIFLHGGPGDTHDYMKRMAAPLFKDFQCFFFDQRGTGGSSDFAREASRFKVDLLLSDLEAVRKYFSLTRPALVGHSWGGMYALFACAKYPDAFSKAALISMGPLDVAAGAQQSENLLATLTSEEKNEWLDLRRQRSAARDAGELQTVKEIDHRLMRLRVKAWVCDPELRTEFLDEYFLDPPPDREVNKWIWADAEKWFSWDMLSAIKCKTWICAGASDSVPLSQTERLARGLRSSQVSIIDSCGHIPWLEQPDFFYETLRSFLKS